jgi:thiosulfate/3-mercaptopyruvate sulfurtransferase
MAYTNLVSATTLTTHLEDPNWLIFDCRFSLGDINYGQNNYKQGHIPGAYYVDLNKDLSSPVRGYTGRHPLPDFRVLTEKLNHWGANNQIQIVVYDDICNGFAARMWWLLRTMGHTDVAVLDGGFSNWLKQKLPVTTVLPKNTRKGQFRMYLDDSRWLQASEIENGLARRNILVIDARTVERFRGLQEPIDPVAGHIPKAINRPFQANIDENGLFRTTSEIRNQFLAIMKTFSPEQVVHMCGSGVTAINNLLAMEVAGLHGSKLYAGSWSEWITNKNRAVATTD